MSFVPNFSGFFNSFRIDRDSLSKFGFKPSDFVADERATVARPLISIFLDELERRFPDMSELAADIRAAEQSNNFSGRISDLYEKYKAEPEKIYRLTDAVSKLNLLIDGVASSISAGNFINIWRVFRDVGYDENEGRYADSYAPAPIDANFKSVNVNRSPKELIGGVESKWSFRNVSDFLSAMAKSVKTVVFTPHPTEYRSKEARSALVSILNAVREEVVVPMRERMTNHLQKNRTYSQRLRYLDKNGVDTTHLREVIGDFVQIALTPEKTNPDTGKTEISKFSVSDEIDTIIGAAKAASENLRFPWHAFERALERNKAPDEVFGRDERLDLKIRYKVRSWGAGDKDGHAAKFSESTLYEKAQARLARVQKFLDLLKNTEAVSTVLGDYEGLVERLESAQAKLEAVIDRLNEATDKKTGFTILSRKEALEISDAIAYSLSDKNEEDEEAYTKLSNEVLEKLIEYYRNDTRPTGEKFSVDLIDAINNIRNFGLHLLKVENRENADDVRNSLKAFYNEYLIGADGKTLDKEKSDTAEIAAKKQKLIAEKLDQLLLGESPISELAEKFLSEIDDTENLRTYSAKDQYKALGYHNLMRTRELVRKDGMKGSMIIAECTGAGSVMEALALQSAFASVGSGKQAQVVPLFEEFEALKNAPHIIRDLLNYKSFRQHLLSVAGGDISKLNLEIMFAHSDNTKRAGTFASRAGLLLAHDDCRASVYKDLETIKNLFEQDGCDVTDFNIDMTFYQGKSDGHFNRFGVRNPSAMSDTYGIHYLRKMTEQGGDVGFYYDPENLQRRVTSDSGHAAKAIDMREFKEQRKPQALTPLARAIAEGFAETYDDYENNHYQNDRGRGIHYAHPGINYDAFALVAAGSRPSKKKGADNGKTIYGPNKTTPIDVMNIRAIADVEMQYLGYIQATHFAAKNVEHYVVKRIVENEAARAELLDLAAKHFKTRVNLYNVDNTGGEKRYSLTKEGTQALYQLDMLFREIIDLQLYGCVNTRYDLLQDLLKRGETKGISVDPAHRNYIESTITDYLAASKLAIEARGGEVPSIEGLTPYDAACKMRDTILEGPLSQLEEDVREGWERAQPLIHARSEALMEAYVKDNRDPDADELKNHPYLYGWMAVFDARRSNKRA